MRGKVQSVCDDLAGMGITPAYAGKSRESSGCSSIHRDHPRICGEKCQSLFACASAEGSPPHMRGKENSMLETWGFSRITPAYAGKRMKQSAKSILDRDHPRICGEKQLDAGFCSRHAGITPAYAGKINSTPVSAPVTLGSPPRMRGKALLKPRLDGAVGITPAYAGKSTAETTP